MFEEQWELVGAQPLLMCSLVPENSSPRPHVGSHRTDRMCPQHCWLLPFLRLSVFVVTLTVLRSTGQVFWPMSLSWDLSPVFLGMGFGEEGCSREVLFSPCPWLGVCLGLHCQGAPSPFPDPSWTGVSTYVFRDFSAWETCVFPVYLLSCPRVYIAVDSQTLGLVRVRIQYC